MNSRDVRLELTGFPSTGLDNYYTASWDDHFDGQRQYHPYIGSSDTNQYRDIVIDNVSKPKEAMSGGPT